MGGREDPALMMDPANCSPVQLAATRQKINPPPIAACPDGSCMSAHKHPAGCEELDRRPTLKPSQGTQKVQQQPLRHRCSSPARPGDKWDFDTHHMVFAAGRSLVSEFRTSRMFTTLNVCRWFSRSLSKPDHLLCLLWFGLFSVWCFPSTTVMMSGDFFLFP